jgi:broad specificity phosphatase PhoE
MLCDLLLGRNDEVELIGRGLERAARLARHLRRLPISGLRSSRRRRPIHAATLIGEQLALSIRIAQSLNEVDYGRWIGCSSAELELDPAWRGFNIVRTRAQIPGGETNRRHSEAQVFFDAPPDDTQDWARLSHYLDG